MFHFLQFCGISPFHPFPDSVEEGPLSFKEQIEKSIQSVGEKATVAASSEQQPSVTKRLMKKEFEIYEETKVRTVNLNLLCSALKTIQPTSVESERAFSSCSLFVTKLRCSLKPSTIDALCFLREYFKKTT